MEPPLGSSPLFVRSLFCALSTSSDEIAKFGIAALTFGGELFLNRHVSLPPSCRKSIGADVGNVVKPAEAVMACSEDWRVPHMEAGRTNAVASFEGIEHFGPDICQAQFRAQIQFS